MEPKKDLYGLEFKNELIETVKLLTQPGKGILAADESVGTIKKKFDKIGLECTEENRRAYRELLVSTNNLEYGISGVILFQETVYQKTKEGQSFLDVLKQKGIIPGIKLDRGLKQLRNNSDEFITNGFDDLPARAQQFYQAGCRFAKWRCVVKIGQNIPTNLSIRETSYTLARYASICQQNGLVPIVEPEILADGDYDIKKCAQISQVVFKTMFNALEEYGICLEGCLFKPHMIKNGMQSGQKSNSNEVALWTNLVLRNTVPPNLGGIFFLSGGQGELEATNNLHFINKLSNEKGKIWHLSFSYGRALQSTVISTWNGKQENVVKAQNVLLLRSNMNSKATKGEYNPKEENNIFADKSLYEKNYSY